MRLWQSTLAQPSLALYDVAKLLKFYTKYDRHTVRYLRKENQVYYHELALGHDSPVKLRHKLSKFCSKR